MGKLKSLIEFLPPFYKEVDTYKNTSGKGILEQFLELCGTYLEDYITKDIEKTLDLYDISATPSIYLNYLWEFLGEFPFGYTCLINKEKWDHYYNGFDDQATQQAKSNLWTLAKGGAIQLSESRIRDLLKYTLALYKIRGTKQFYEIAFKMFGLTCTVTDPYEGSSYSEARGVYNNYDGWVNSSPLIDEEVTDGPTMDEILHVETCITVNFDIDIDDNNPDIAGGLVNLLEGNILQSVDLADLVTNSNPDDPMLTKLRLTIEGFIKRFLPFNCKALVTYAGVKPDPGITITVAPETEGNTHLIMGEIDSIKAIITVQSIWLYSDLSYQVSADGGSTWGKPKTDKEYIITKEGTYKFRSLEDPTKIATLVIDRYPIEITYDLTVVNTENPQTTELTRTNTSIGFRVWAYKKADILVNGNTVLYYFRNLPFIDILTGRVYNPEVLDDEGAYTEISLDTPGLHRISLLEFRSYYQDIEITTEVPDYVITFSKKSGNSWVAIDPTQVTEFDGSIQVKVEATNNYGDQNLKIRCISNGKTYTSGDVLTLEATGEYQFVCVTDTEQNISVLKLKKVSVVKWRIDTYQSPYDKFDTDREVVTQGDNGIVYDIAGIKLPIVMDLIKGDITNTTQKVNVYYKNHLLTPGGIPTHTRENMGTGFNRRYLSLALIHSGYGYALIDLDTWEGDEEDEDDYIATHLDQITEWTALGSGDWKIQSVDDPTAYVIFKLYHNQGTGTGGYTGLALYPSPHQQDNYLKWDNLVCADGKTYSHWNFMENDSTVISELYKTEGSDDVWSLDDILDMTYILEARVMDDNQHSVEGVGFEVWLVVDGSVVSRADYDWYSWYCPFNITGTPRGGSETNYGTFEVMKDIKVNGNNLPIGNYTITLGNYQVQEILSTNPLHIRF